MHIKVVLLGNGKPERAKLAAKPPIFASYINLPIFSALPGFRNLNNGDRDWFLCKLRFHCNVKSGIKTFLATSLISLLL